MYKRPPERRNSSTGACDALSRSQLEAAANRIQLTAQQMNRYVQRHAEENEFRGMTHLLEAMGCSAAYTFNREHTRADSEHPSSNRERTKKKPAAKGSPATGILFIYLHQRLYTRSCSCRSRNCCTMSKYSGRSSNR